MVKYLICYPGGAGGNFLASLIRILDNSQYPIGDISITGGCDHIAGAGAIFGYYFANNKELYPENQTTAREIAELILDMKRLDGFTTSLSDGSYIMGVHYVTKESIALFESIERIKIIYISVHSDWYEQVALNKVAKNYISIDQPYGNTREWAKEIAKTLRFQGFSESADLMENGTDILSAPRQVKEDLITAWVQRLAEANYMPVENENLMVIDFKDIMLNKDLVLDKISKFTNRSLNPCAKKFYNEYISMQPKLEEFLTC